MRILKHTLILALLFISGCLAAPSDPVSVVPPAKSVPMVPTLHPVSAGTDASEIDLATAQCDVQRIMCADLSPADRMQQLSKYIDVGDCDTDVRALIDENMERWMMHGAGYSNFSAYFPHSETSGSELYVNSNGAGVVYAIGYACDAEEWTRCDDKFQQFDAPRRDRGFAKAHKSASEPQ